ncbi:regulatory protein RecX [Desulfotomaculum copahuensis]|uniref:Regulatory protein RecX n=1 Tax=Desulfotomaculum copahuensis TaxID=1838280 RepID=A0A1B7LJF1_9FIRM|nr:regulatory protein RecX [Desulfotomaculum copahuensis]OAT86695.1 hypothetical protein A6M21_02410 [Desulfotomaculum copahuensis]
MTEQGDFQRARERACRLLARRARSRQELARRLAMAGFEPPVIGQVLDRLQEAGLLDDLAFARQWVSWRLAEHPLGRTGLDYELRQKGVPAEIIEQALAGLDEEKQFQSALELAGRRRERMGERYAWPKVAAFLQRRGYKYDIIFRVYRCLEGQTGDKP